MSAEAKSGWKEGYLVIYNAVMTIMSLICLYSTVYGIAMKGTDRIWEAAGTPFCIAQCLALFETIHAALGISRGSPATAFCQWMGKSNVVLVTMKLVPEVQNHLATSICFFVWSFGEVPRYYYYLTSIITDKGIPLVTWLRYNLFIVLYPTGMLAELVLMYLALPYLKERNILSFHMPNALNFGFDYSLLQHVVVPTYPFIWAPLYLYMFKQRKNKMKKKVA